MMIDNSWIFSKVEKSTSDINMKLLFFWYGSINSFICLCCGYIGIFLTGLFLTLLFYESSRLCFMLCLSKNIFKFLSCNITFCTSPPQLLFYFFHCVKCCIFLLFPGAHLFEKWLTPWKAQIVLGGGNILLIKIEIKCPIGQNLEIMTFR